MARRSPLVLRSAVVLALLAVARPAGAHPFGPPPTAELTVDGGTIEILWRARADDVMALATSVGAFAEQPDEGRPETGAEIVARSPEVRRYLVEGVVAFQGGMSCHTDVLDQADLVEGGARLRLTCPRPVAAVEVEISLLHDLHESYRTLLSAPGASPGRAAFTSTAPRQRFAFARVGSPVPLLGSLVARLDGTAGIAAIGLALIAGLLHGLGPGHAKLAGAALLAGSPGTRRRAAALGGIVAGMHAASTIALAAALYSFTRVGAQIERVTGWLQLAAGVLVLAVGVAMLARRRRHPGHHHGPASGATFSRKGLVAIALAGGILPSPAAFLTLATAMFAGRFAMGLGLVAAFSLGLAVTVAVAGLLGLESGSFLHRHGHRSRLVARLSAGLPILAALAIVTVGAVTSVVALARL